MKLVLSIEGTDGAGKSTLAQFIKRLCEQRNERFVMIGRRGPTAGELAAKLSRILQEDKAHLTPEVEIAIRLARESQRAVLAAQVPSGLVVLDRFLLSFLAMIRLCGQTVDPLLQIVQDIAIRAQLHATVFVQCPFETAWERMKRRNAKLSRQTNRGELVHRRLAQFMAEDFERGLLTGEQWLVDNSQSQHPAEEQLTAYLRPYFLKRPISRTVEIPGE
jgi:thymidylate kinase